MMLHQIAPHKLVSGLGSKEHPIVLVETESQGETSTLSSHYASSCSPKSPSFTSSSNTPSNSLQILAGLSKNSVGKGKAPIRTGTLRQHDLLQATSMTPVQDVEHASLKRKYATLGDSEDALLDSAKKTKKAEKKRRKKERRASRISQLVESMPSSTPYIQGFNTASWSAAHQPPSIHFNPKILPKRPSWAHPILGGGPGFPPGFQTHQSPHFVPTASNVYEMDVEQNGLEHFSSHNSHLSLPPNLEDGFSDSQENVSMEETPFQENLYISQSQTDTLGSNRPTRSLSPFVPDTISINDMIISKQDSLDRAIAENKETLAQLGVPKTTKQKSILMKSFSERNKFVHFTPAFIPIVSSSLHTSDFQHRVPLLAMFFRLIAQLTGEIKAHFAALKPVPAPANICDLPRFQWPETQFPLYVVLSDSEDEESDSDA